MNAASLDLSGVASYGGLMERTMYRGDTLVLEKGLNAGFFTIVDANDAPIDLTGATVWFTVKRTYIEPDAQAVAAVVSGVVNTKGTVTIQNQASQRGQVKILLAPAATLNFPDGDVKLVYDVQMKDAAGVITTIEGGTITVTPDVTRATS